VPDEEPIEPAPYASMPIERTVFASNSAKLWSRAFDRRDPQEIERFPNRNSLISPLADTNRGNGDGELERGEFVTLYLTVELGKGKSYKTQANLRNLSVANFAERRAI